MDRKPTLDEYLELTNAVGWSRYITAPSASGALENSLYSVVAEQDGEAVGMARIVGDSALFLYVQDVLVVPSCQGSGVGGAIMDRLMQWLDERVPDRVFVGLFSATGKTPFYERYGFYPAASQAPEMYQYLRLPEESIP